MGYLLAAVALVAMTGASASAAIDMRVTFNKFKAQFGRKYATQEEESQRFAIFISNMRKAQRFQSVNPHATFGANEYADMSAEEFKTRHNGNKWYANAVKKSAASPKKTFTAVERARAAGSAVDWRTKGAVTYVKNQGQCGSCWSFSTTGGIEGQWFLAGNPLVAVSEQELVSCDTIDSGCQGGLMDNAFDWLMQAKNGSIVTESSYPYVSGGGDVPACSTTGTVFGAQIIGHQDIAHDETTMATWVFTGGPLSIAVDATSWQTYTSGIMTNCISQALDHGVLIVGFNDANSPPYWIIKNSWGASWGESGYIRVAKGSNQCLITNYPTTSLVSKAGPSPSPPTPPAPGKKEFTQVRCSDATCGKCKEEETIVLPEGECIVGANHSYIAMCGSADLTVKVFVGRKCQGAAVATTTNALNTCGILFDSIRTEEFVKFACHNGPAPAPTPAPQTPAPVTPAPAQQVFTQMDCSDAACSQGCQNATFQANVCLQLAGGGSAIAQCTPGQLTITEYPLATNCQGTSIPSSMALDQCLQNGDGNGYFENFCPGQSAMPVAAKKGKKLATTKRQQ